MDAVHASLVLNDKNTFRIRGYSFSLRRSSVQGGEVTGKIFSAW